MWLNNRWFYFQKTTYDSKVYDILVSKNNDEKYLWEICGIINKQLPLKGNI
jgi:hypothetical protein